MTAIHLFNGSWTNRSRVGKEFVRNLQIISNISLKKVRWTIHFRSIKNFSFFSVWINTVQFGPYLQDPFLFLFVPYLNIASTITFVSYIKHPSIHSSNLLTNRPTDIHCKIELLSELSAQCWGRGQGSKLTKRFG